MKGNDLKVRWNDTSSKIFIIIFWIVQGILRLGCKVLIRCRTLLCSLEGLGRLILFLSCGLGLHWNIGGCLFGRNSFFLGICRFQQRHTEVCEQYGPREPLLKFLLCWELLHCPRSPLHQQEHRWLHGYSSLLNCRWSADSWLHRGPTLHTTWFWIRKSIPFLKRATFADNHM